MNQKTLTQAFEAQVIKTPKALCLWDDKHQYSYDAAQAMIENMAQHLLAYGVTKGDSVAVYMQKTVDMVLVFLAIAKIGAQCLQCDLAFPIPLIQMVLEESGAGFVITDLNISKAEFNQLPIIELTTLKTSVTATAKNWPVVVPEDVVWQVYSSGTTGRPKGVAIPHRAMVSSYYFRYEVSDYQAGDRIGANIYLLWEVFRPLLLGGAVYIISDALLHDTPKLLEAIKAQQLTEILLTPSFAEMLLDYDADQLQQAFKTIQTCWLNGEVVSTTLSQQLKKTFAWVRFINLYSISECHDVCAFDISAAKQLEGDITPVGKIFDAVSAVILNEAGEICPANTPGELYIGGDGLAHGYINRPDLNKERFIEENDSPVGQRLYKTGDFAALDANRQLTIMGRCDYIVKLRGYTISLPAVVATMKAELSLVQCAVIMTGDSLSEKRLVAYLQPQDMHEAKQQWQIDPTTGISRVLHKLLLQHLAHYMVPSAFILVEEIKQNAYSSKLDLKSLPKPPKPVVVSAPMDVLKQEGVKTLEMLKILWASVLQIPVQVIEATDMFFELGGTSLKAIQLVNLLNQCPNINIHIKDFLQHASLESLFAFLQSTHEDKANLQAQLEQDSVVSLAMTGQQSIPADFSKAKVVFMTGVTGFLGSFLLAEILKTTTAKIYCLVRAKSHAEAMQRLTQQFQRFQLGTQDLEARVIALPGDLSKNKLGLSSHDYDTICNKAQAIVHAGAWVNLFYPYAQLKPSNVEGTKSVLQIATAIKLKPVYYISTNGVFPNASQQFPESSDIAAYASQLESGYTQSKWVAENLVWHAKAQGVPVMLFRPGNIGAHSQTGVANPNDFNRELLTGINQMKACPSNLNLEATPVDCVVSSIMTAMFAEVAEGQVYNLASNHIVTWQDLKDSLKADYQACDYQAWLDLLPSTSALHAVLAQDQPQSIEVAARFEQAGYLALLEKQNLTPNEIMQKVIIEFTQFLNKETLNAA